MTYELAFLIYVIGNLITMHILFGEIANRVISETDLHAKMRRRNNIHWYVKVYSLNMKEAAEWEDFNHNEEGQLIALCYAAKLVKITNFIMVITCSIAVVGYVYIGVWGGRFIVLDIPAEVLLKCISITVFCTLPNMILETLISIRIKTIFRTERKKFDEYRLTDRPSRNFDQTGGTGRYIDRIYQD